MPGLETERLLLRPPCLRDVPAITALLGDYDVAKNLATVPHPYGEDAAKVFVAEAADARARGESFNFAMESRVHGAYMGQSGLRLQDGCFRLGYWLGKPYWGRGLATEAARRVLAFGFYVLKAERVRAGWFHDNPASGRVLEKLGFRPDGAEPRNSLARGHAVYCHMMTLTREDFGRKRAA